MSRIALAEPPYEPEVAEQLTRMMPNGDPIRLFRLFVRNLPMARAMSEWGSYELSRRLSLSLREREIVIDRTCARAACEYEWGVHIAHFAERAGLDTEQIRSITHGAPSDRCWTQHRERLLIRAADALHDRRDIDDGLWAEFAGEFAEPEIIDLVVLCGWYQLISTFTRTMRLPNEPGTPTFTSVA